MSKQNPVLENSGIRAVTVCVRADFSSNWYLTIEVTNGKAHTKGGEKWIKGCVAENSPKVQSALSAKKHDIAIETLSFKHPHSAE